MANVRTTLETTRVADSKSRVPRWKPRTWLVALVIGAVTLLGIGLYFVNAHWPYRYRVVKPLLEDVLGSQLTIAHYHRTYFPNPGFVATGLTLRRKTAPDIPPLGSADTLFVQGRWIDLLMLRERVQLVEITSLHIVIPPAGSRANHEDFPPGSAADFAGPETLIEQLRIHNGVLDVMRTNGKRLSFPIAELDISNFRKGIANAYTVDMQNAKPWGRIHSVGSFGPLDANNLGSTPVSGAFTFSSVKLRDIGNIRGTLFSSGRFGGSLGTIEASATSETPDFAVDNGMPTPVSGEVVCDIYGLTGEVVLRHVAVKSGTTTAIAKGGVQGSPKITNLDFALMNGRAQDVMRPFIHSNVPITGPVWLRGHAYVGPSQPGVGFLQRLRVDGVFDVPAERLTNPASEKSLSAFSQRVQVSKSDKRADDSSSEAEVDTDVLSSVKGPVSIRNGIASSQHVTFTVAGARANLSGTFNFHNQNVHLVGDLATQSDASHITTGFKSFLLKPLSPFLKKRHAGAVVPIAVTGSPGQYKVSSDFSHEK